MLEYVKFLNEYINVPAKLIVGIVVILLAMQLIGELLELFGKAAPGIMKLRKKFAAKREREFELLRAIQEAKEVVEEAKNLLDKVDKHYDEDNISKRDKWMHSVDEDISLNKADISFLKEKLEEVYDISIKDHIEALRSVIIGFANRISDHKSQLSHEEFRRVFAAHADYEDFLEKHELENGQVDIAFRVITDDYAERLRNREFLEDIMGYHREA